jgi:hypothetical protein
MSGYVLLFVLLVRLLRTRQSLERHAVLDALTVCLALGLASVLLLALPALDIPGRPPVEAVIIALYPPLDVIVLLLTVNVTFTATSLPASLVAWITGATMMFVGDAAVAITALSGRTSTSPLLEVPSLLTFTTLAVCALHPSVAELSRADRRPIQAWSGHRIMVLAPALATPFLLLATIGGRSTGTRLLIAVGGVLTVVMLLLRAVSAATAYHWVYRDRVKPWLIADLLILKQAMPRSLIACYESIDRALDALARDDGRSGLAQRQARAMYAKLERSSMTEIFQGGLHEFITGFILDNARLSSTISDQYLFN